MPFSDYFIKVERKYYTIIQLRHERHKKLNLMIFSFLSGIILFLVSFFTKNISYLFIVLTILTLLIAINPEFKVVFVYPNINAIKKLLLVLLIIVLIGNIVVMVYCIVKVCIYDSKFTDEKEKFDGFKDHICAYNSSTIYETENKIVGYGTIKLIHDNNNYYLHFGRDFYLGNNKTKENLLNLFGTNEVTFEQQFILDFEEVINSETYFSTCKFDSESDQFKICYIGDCLYGSKYCFDSSETNLISISCLMNLNYKYYELKIYYEKIVTITVIILIPFTLWFVVYDKLPSRFRLT